jgi:hypothetical protein
VNGSFTLTNANGFYNNNINESDYFMGYLYMYCIIFDSISLYKPNTSKPDNGEFYVIGKGFKGITDEQLDEKSISFGELHEMASNVANALKIDINEVSLITGTRYC